MRHCTDHLDTSLPASVQDEIEKGHFPKAPGHSLPHLSGVVHWDDPEGLDGEGGGRGIQDGELMYSHG